MANLPANSQQTPNRITVFSSKPVTHSALQDRKIDTGMAPIALWVTFPYSHAHSRAPTALLFR